MNRKRNEESKVLKEIKDKEAMGYQCIAHLESFLFVDHFKMQSLVQKHFQFELHLLIVFCLFNILICLQIFYWYFI